MNRILKVVSLPDRWPALDERKKLAGEKKTCLRRKEKKIIWYQKYKADLHGIGRKKPPSEFNTQPTYLEKVRKDTNSDFFF